jgi:hypothetical protein
MDDLARRFRRLTDEYGPRKAAAEASVVRWRWYTDATFDLRPFWYERHRWPRGRQLTRRPSLAKNHARCGFDAAGRPIAAHEFSGFLGGACVYETFRTHQPDLVEECRFSADGKAIYLHRYELDGGRLQRWSGVAQHGSGREEYHYLDDKVAGIEVAHREQHASAHPEQLLPYQTIAVRYDPSGDLEQLETTWLTGTEPHAEITYRRPPEDFSITGLCGVITDRLVRLVPEAIASARLPDTAYCLVLTYDGANYLPTLAVGLDVERRGWLARLGDEAPDYLWNPAEFEHYATEDLDDPQLDRDMRLLEQELGLSGRWTLGRDMLVESARRLNRRDWSAILPTTDDFVVYPVDVELADLQRNLQRCAPPRLVRAFRARGWL